MKALMTFTVAAFVFSTAHAGASSVPKLNCLGVRDSQRIYEIKDLNGPSPTRILMLKISDSDPKVTAVVADSTLSFSPTSSSVLPDQKNAISWSADTPGNAEGAGRIVISVVDGEALGTFKRSKGAMLIANPGEWTEPIQLKCEPSN